MSYPLSVPPCFRSLQGGVDSDLGADGTTPSQPCPPLPSDAARGVLPTP